MHSDLLLTLGALTLGGAVAVALLALTFRASRTRYAARWRCWIWVLLCLRLVVPHSFLTGGEESHQAPIRLPVPEDTVVYEYTPPDRVETPSQPSAAPTPGASATEITPAVTAPVTTAPPAAEPAAKVSLSLWEVVFRVWLAGIAVMGLWTLIAHLRFVRYLRRWGRPVEAPELIRLYNGVGDRLNLDRRPALRVCPGLRAPMLAGLLHPALLLPEELPGEEMTVLRCVLVHELTHYRRRDIWLKSLALLANIVHWFNPLMWYMVRLVERDTELACDEAALRVLPPEDHAAYGRVILDTVERLKKP